MTRDEFIKNMQWPDQNHIQLSPEAAEQLIDLINQESVLLTFTKEQYQKFQDVLPNTQMQSLSIELDCRIDDEIEDEDGMRVVNKVTVMSASIKQIE